MTGFEEWLQKYGPVVAMLIVAGVTNYRGLWVWGYVLKAAEARHAEALKAEEARHGETKSTLKMWQETALHALGLARSATNVIERRGPS